MTDMASDRITTLFPGATPSHAYLIVAGILLGVLAGPGVLGRVAPEIHRQLFGGPDPAQVQQTMQSHRERVNDQLDRLRDSGVSKEAVDEQMVQWAAEEEAIVRAFERQRTEGVLPKLVAVGLAIVVVMLIEAIFGVAPGADGRAVVWPSQARLVTVRYGLLGLGVMLVLAQPAVLAAVKPVFALILLAVALGAGLVPLGTGRAEAGREGR